MPISAQSSARAHRRAARPSARRLLARLPARRRTRVEQPEIADHLGCPSPRVPSCRGSRGSAGAAPAAAGGSKHRGPERPTVDDDALGVSVGVESDHVDGHNRYAADLGRVVLDIAVAPKGDEGEILRLVELAGNADEVPNRLGALYRAVEQRSLEGDVAGQLPHPRGLAVHEPARRITVPQGRRKDVSCRSGGDVAHDATSCRGTSPPRSVISCARLSSSSRPTSATCGLPKLSNIKLGWSTASFVSPSGSA